MSITLKNRITIIQKLRKTSASPFNELKPGEVIDIEYPFGDIKYLAGITALMKIYKEGTLVGENKTIQLRNNLSNFLILPEFFKPGFEHEELFYSKWALNLIISGQFKVKELKKKTSAFFFKELKPGDEFELQLDLDSGGTPLIHVYQDGKLCHKEMASRLQKVLINNFELEQLN